MIAIAVLSLGHSATDFSSEVAYEVCKIDTVKNWYLVYVSRNDSVFKIASMQTNGGQCENEVRVGGKYCLTLNKRLENTLSLYGLKLIVTNYLDVKGSTMFNPDTDVFVGMENDVFGLYTTDNLSGLCYVEQGKQEKL